MKILLFISAILFPILVVGQVPTQSENYIKTTIYRDVNSANPVHSITYFDGLGRPIQQIANAQSNSGKDIVTPIEYDAIGRQVNEYLPFVSSQNTMAYTSGSVLVPALVSQYQTQYGDANPYSEKLLKSRHSTEF